MPPMNPTDLPICPVCMNSIGVSVAPESYGEPFFCHSCLKTFTPHNPARLTVEQIGTRDGWRLLEVDEVGPDVQPPRAGQPIGTYHVWRGGSWHEGSWNGLAREVTYRTKLSRSELRQARGLEPENFTTPKPEQTDARPAEPAAEQWPGPLPDEVCEVCDGGPGNSCQCACGHKAYPSKRKYIRVPATPPAQSAEQPVSREAMKAAELILFGLNTALVKTAPKGSAVPSLRGTAAPKIAETIQSAITAALAEKKRELAQARDVATWVICDPGSIRLTKHTRALLRAMRGDGDNVYNDLRNQIYTERAAREAADLKYAEAVARLEKAEAKRQAFVNLLDHIGFYLAGTEHDQISKKILVALMAEQANGGADV